MKKTTLVLLGVALVGASVLSYEISTASEQEKPSKKRSATVEQLMEGIVKPQCTELGKIAKAAPADDKAWKHYAINAAMLNEMAHAMMQDGRCPDATWKEACDMLEKGSNKMLAKIKAKDAEGAAATFKSVTDSCAKCHKAHKKSYK